MLRGLADNKSPVEKLIADVGMAAERGLRPRAWLRPVAEDEKLQKACYGRIYKARRGGNFAAEDEGAPRSFANFATAEGGHGGSSRAVEIARAIERF